MKLKEELNRLKEIIRTDPDGSMKIIEDIKRKYTSAEDKKLIDNFIRDGLSNLTSELEEFNKDISIRIQMAEVSEMVSLSYIAKKYFGRTAQWLYQRINGNIVNGKPAKFTDEEIKTFNSALQDISKKIGSLALNS